MVEQAGYTITLCDGESRNLKITTPDDLKMAAALLNMQDHVEKNE